MSLSGGRGLILWTQRSGGSSVFQYKVKLLMGKGTGHHYIHRNYRIFRLRIHLGFCKCYRRFMILSYITCGEITFITLSGGPGQAFKDLSLADFLILFGKTRYLTLWFDLKFWQCYCKLLIKLSIYLWKNHFDNFKARPMRGRCTIHYNLYVAYILVIPSGESTEFYQ